MRKLWLIITALAIFFTASVPAVVAQRVISEENIIIPTGRTIDQDLFATGKTVIISGTVNGDVYAAGGNIIVEGTINGDLLAAGGVVNVSGTVSQDIRAAGGQIEVSGNVGNSLTVAGGSVTVSSNAEVGGSVVAAGGNLTLQSPIGRGITASAGNMTVGNSVGGNVLAAVGSLSLTPNANVNGNLTYISTARANIPEGARVGGTVERQQPPVTDREARETVREMAEAWRNLAITAIIVDLLASFILGVILLRLLPFYTRTVADIIRNRFWASLGIGFLILILVPIAVVVLLMSVVGIPLALILLAWYLVDLYLAKIFVAVVLGRWILAVLERGASDILSLLVGLIVYGILAAIPVIGPLLALIVTVVGLGAKNIGTREYYLNLRAKKIA